jgi:hypothetical protein
MLRTSRIDSQPKPTKPLDFDREMLDGCLLIESQSKMLDEKGQMPTWKWSSSHIRYLSTPVSKVK